MSRSKRPEGQDRRRGSRNKGGGGKARGKGGKGWGKGSERDRAVRIRPGQHGVPGERAVTELLRAQPTRVRRLLVDESREFPVVIELAEAADIAIERVERDELDSWVGPGLARGVLALADPPRRWDFEDLLARDQGPRTRRGHRLIVACDGVVDPHNLGAILRSAEFFGAEAVVWPRDRSAPLSPAAVRASAGASERVALGELTNLARALEQAKRDAWWVVGTVVDEGQALHELALDPPERAIVVVGSEHRGIRRLTRERCDFLVTIERAGSLGSPNVSAAAAVVLAALG